MYFPFLEKYKISLELIEEQGAKSIGNQRHLFFALPEYQIQEALNAFSPFPEELKTLYYEIGFGFMHRAKLGKFNTLFDPMTLIYTNKQINYFATPEIIDELKYYDIDKYLLFFKTAANRYLAIDRETVEGENTICYRGTAIEDSLYDFLRQVDYNPDYPDQQINDTDYEQEAKKEETQQEKTGNEETNNLTSPTLKQSQNHPKWSALLEDDDNVIIG